MTDSNFWFISPEVKVTFEESTAGAILTATVMELEKASRNGRLYRIEEAEQIAKSLKGVDVYYGTDWAGRHDNPVARGEKSKAKPVGIVERAWIEGNKVKARIRIIGQGIIEALKQGVKYLFSVGGNAVSETIKKIGNKLVHILKGARVNHLQIIDEGTPVGFPNAKMEKLIEINETVLLCKDGVCECPVPITGTPKRTIKHRIIEEHNYEFTVTGGELA